MEQWTSNQPKKFIKKISNYLKILRISEEQVKAQLCVKEREAYIRRLYQFCIWLISRNTKNIIDIIVMKELIHIVLDERLFWIINKDSNRVRAIT